jgi:hypothetical protein
MPPSNKRNLIIFAVAMMSFLAWIAPPATAQTCVSYDPFSSILPGVDILKKTLEQDMPGLVDKRIPFVCPPTFGAEARVRAIFMNLSGGLHDDNTDQTFDFTGDLGYEQQGIIIESIVRLQFSRLSLRGVYDAYLRTFRGGGAGGRFDWPEFHYGFDFDLYNTPCVRFGLDMDFYPRQPTFSVRQLPGIVAATSVSIVAPRPVTAGLYFVYNPINIGSLQWSFETRARRSVRTGTKIDEVEVATGVLTPETVLGEIGLRGGYRYTKLELQSDPYVTKARWSAWFGELVYYF